MFQIQMKAPDGERYGAECDTWAQVVYSIGWLQARGYTLLRVLETVREGTL